LIFVLPNASYGNTETIAQFAIAYRYISAVCFERNAVISVVHSPVIKDNMRRVNGICTIGVGYIE
jgi:hypothetical protein